MTTRDAVEASGAAARSRRAKGVTITVRLFPEVHGTALAALARVPHGSRSARVIHLLTIGFMYEQGYGHGAAKLVPVSTPVAANTSSPDAVAMLGEDLAFVSGVLENPEV